jgi:hypothetical protein
LDVVPPEDGLVVVEIVGETLLMVVELLPDPVAGVTPSTDQSPETFAV